MFNNKNIRLSIFAFLVFSVFTSKNILIFNEETLVAIGFFSFFFFILYFFGSTFKDSLNERSQMIHDELVDFLLLKEKSLNDLLIQHKKFSGLVKAMNVLTAFTQTELTQLQSHGQPILKNKLSSKILTKFKMLDMTQSMVQQKLHYLLADRILSNVLVAFPKKGKRASKFKAFQNKAIKRAIDSLVFREISLD